MYPDWFQRCLDTPCVQGETHVSGSSINFVSWGEAGNPGVVLVHGSNAHLEWWRMIAPLLCDDFHVVALDLSGSGHSGWREQYSDQLFAEETMAVAAAVSMTQNPFVVGHSFGGMVALESGHRYGDRLGGVMMVDFTIQPPGVMDEIMAAYDERMKQPIRPTRVYPDRETALGRFRLVPEQVCSNPFLVPYLGEHALREVEGGWTWRFDPGMFAKLQRSARDSGTEKLNSLACPAAFVLAEESHDYSRKSLDYTLEMTRGRMPVFTVPGTRHHLMLDEPYAVAMAIKGVLLSWAAHQ